MFHKTLWLIATISTLREAALKSTYVIPTEPLTKSSTQCPPIADRCLTLKELIDNGSRWSASFAHDGEVIFREGIHLVNGTQNKALRVVGSYNVAFRGEVNATI